MGTLNPSADTVQANRLVGSSSLVGLALVLIIGLAAYWLSTLHESLEALAVALLLGMVVRGVIGDQMRLRPGIQLASKIFIPLGIILYGVRLDIPRLGGLALPVLAHTLVNMALFYLIVLGLHRWWPLRRATSVLLASGSAVCGASAIVVLSPLADAESEDTSVSLIVVTSIGLLGAMLYPALKLIFNWSDQFYAVLAGSTLHQTATVRLAVAGLAQEVVNYALTVKMVRVVMLIPLSFLVAWLGRRQDRSGRSTLRQVWFVFAFAAVGLLVSFTPLRSYQSSLAPWSTLALGTAMASIGLSMNLGSVIDAGLRPLIIGVVAWLAVLMMFILSATVLPIG